MKKALGIVLHDVIELGSGFIVGENTYRLISFDTVRCEEGGRTGNRVAFEGRVYRVVK